MMTGALDFISAAAWLGIGGTLAFDIWGLLLKGLFGIAPSNICFVGRWLRGMPEGTFRHVDIRNSPSRSGECALGWLGHYSIGISLAGMFVLLAGDGWLAHPAPGPALLFGIVTVAAPLFVMQPAFGFGLAGEKSAKPWQVRLRSFMNHLAFGAGLYAAGILWFWYVMVIG